VVIDNDMSRQTGVTRHNDVIAESAIVRNVDVDEQQIVGTNNRGLPIIRGAMDSNAFAENVLITNLQARVAALELQILRLHSDGGEGKHLIPLPHVGMAIYNHMRMQLTVFPQRDVFADDAKWPDFAAGGNVCFGMNNGGGMNH
jgi:hypothetical protein